MTRARVAAWPAWVWLGALVLVSAAIRLALGKPHPAPWIFGDEMIYANLAESFAKTGSFAFRDAPGLYGYGFGYPVLISPAYAVFDDLAHAFAAAKAINSLVMSLAAIPVFLIARRLVSSWLALLAAGLSLAIPSMLYTGTIMTENAFYPAFCACAFAFFAVLERPTLWRQLSALALVGLAFLIRAQAAVLVPAFVTAIVVVCLVEARLEGRLRARDLLRRLDAFRVTWAALAGGLLIVFGLELVRGRSPADVLGAYGVLAERSYSVSDVGRWFVFHAAELDLYLGILPFAALIALGAEAFGRAALPRPLRLFGVLAVSLAVWMTLVVAATASYFARADNVGRIEERNLFHLAPLFLIALVVWVNRGLPRAWPVAGLAALIAGGLPGAIPYNTFANLGALSDTFVFIPLWNIVYFGHIRADSLSGLITVCTLGAGVLFLLWPRRLALVPVVLVLGWFILLQVAVERQINGTSRGVLQLGLGARRAWIDEAVGGNAQVAALWTGNVNEMVVLQNEFFNRSVHPVYAFAGAPGLSAPLPETSVTVDPVTGKIEAPGGSPVRAEYALADRSVELAGREVARDPILRTGLYRVDGDLRLARQLSGVYTDAWTGAEATYTRWGCRGGRLRLTVASWPGLFERAQTVAAVVGSRVVGHVRVPPSGVVQSVLVPLSPSEGRCVLQLHVSQTAVPANVLGVPDSREIGVRLVGADYEPPRQG